MLPGRGRLRALVCLLACAQLAPAAYMHPHLLWLRADDATDTTDVAAASSTTAVSAKTTAATTKHTVASTTATTTKADTTTAKADTTHSSSSSSATMSVTSSSLAASSTANTTLFNITSISAGQLPLQPELTPGWGVAGVLLIGTGMTYGLIGIRNQVVQTFFSAAYLGALGATVLVLYVLSPPVRPAVQGAYVVAATGTGVALGGLAVVFRDLAEGLGCLLGGFCLGMWLLCLRAGGLLHREVSVTASDAPDGFVSGTEVDATGTTVFLVAFTAGVYALSFSRRTRMYALPVSIALAGATATVLGIDAFSRAGLKEFWVYVWHLNSDNGSAESSSSGSGNSLFPLATATYPLTRGLRVELAVTMVLAAAGVVSQLQLWRIMQARRERHEAKLADEEAQRQRVEMDIGAALEARTARARMAWAAVYDERRAHGAVPLPEPPFSLPPKSPADSGVGSDMASEKAAAKTADGAAIEMDDLQEKDRVLKRDGQTVTVCVVAEDGTMGEVKNEDDDEEEKKAHPQVPKSPAGGSRIVPLPFAVPTRDGDDDDEDRSSRAATVADEEDVPTPTTRRPNRASVAKRLSTGSVGLLRSLSQRSCNKLARAAPAVADTRSESQEALVSAPARRASRADDETDSAAGYGCSESVAATLDGVSSSEDGEDGEDGRAKEENDEEKEKEEKEDQTEDQPATLPPLPLTKDRLPRSLSRVALSYRTNEWAKHLSHADTPEPVADVAAPEAKEAEAADAETSDNKTVTAAADDNDDNETPAPVDVAALQQTAATGAPPPAVVRQSGLRPSVSEPRLSAAGPGHGTIPSTVLQHESIAEETGADTARSDSGGSNQGHVSPTVMTTIPPPVPGVVSCTAPQSLLGQRDMLRRNFSQQASASGGGGLARTSPAAAAARGRTVNGSTVNDSTASPVGGGDGQRTSRMMVHSGSLASLTRPASWMRPAGPMPPSSPTVPALPTSLTLPASPGAAASPGGVYGAFNSHQPKRGGGGGGGGHRPSAAAREAQLATFRNSVAADLRASPPLGGGNLRLAFASSSTTVNRAGSGNYASNSRDSFAAMPAGVTGTPRHPHPYLARAPSAASFAAGSPPLGPPAGDALDAHRSTLLGQRDAAAQQRAQQRLGQARVDRAFEERIRQGGGLLEAHREALRRMQTGTK